MDYLCTRNAYIMHYVMDFKATFLSTNDLENILDLGYVYFEEQIIPGLLEYMRSCSTYNLVLKLSITFYFF